MQDIAEAKMTPSLDFVTRGHFFLGADKRHALAPFATADNRAAWIGAAIRSFCDSVILPRERPYATALNATVPNATVPNASVQSRRSQSYGCESFRTQSLSSLPRLSRLL